VGFLGAGIIIGFLLFHSLVLIHEKGEVIQMTALEKAELERDLERVQVINRESTRNMLGVVSEVQRVLETTYGDRRSFLLELIPLALKHQAEDQIPASALIAMAIYESDYGRSDLAQDHNNFFGIKAWESTWQGEVARMSTVDLGQRKMANFRVYSNFEAGVEGYARFIQKSDRYQKAFDYGDGPSFVRELLKGGYCPDRDYLTRIKGIMKRHDLNRLDLHRLMPTIAADSGMAGTASTTN
jgi:flagellum-specific peptidoglycan hydrolase FlgJ